MLSKLRARLTYANVMATIAVFVALGGTSYAAIKVTSKNVPNNALTGADIKNLTGKDVRNNSLTGADVRNLGSADVTDSSLLAQDFAAGQLPAGTQGPQGERGPEGPSTGPAGGDLDGTYPAPTLRDGAVTAAKIGALPAVRVQQDDALVAEQTITSSGGTVFTNVVFQEELYDTDGMFDPAQPDRITIRTTGVYSISGAVRWDSNATGTRSAGIVPNTTTNGFLAADTRPAASTTNQATRQNISTMARLAAGTVLVLKVSQDSGVPLEVDNLGSPQVHLAATWLGP